MIYLLEDEASIRKLVLYTLENSGLQARGFGSVSDFWNGMHEKTPDLILLDIMLPDGDGLEVLKKLRASVNNGKIPVMMLTAKGTEYDKVLGLDMGADDYLPKPFGMMELVARVKSLLRRTSEASAEFRIAGLYVNIPRHLVTADGEIVTLTLKEFDILTYMLRNPGIVLSREQIMAAVWGYDFDGENRTVDVHIRTLRTKLKGCAGLIETVRGVGYRIGGRH